MVETGDERDLNGTREMRGSETRAFPVGRSRFGCQGWFLVNSVGDWLDTP